MDFNILGELRVLAGDLLLPIGGPREQKILATLLVNADAVVSVDQLVDAVWDVAPPATSRNQIRNRISQLRRSWAPVGANGVIVTETAGYRIEVAANDLDATRFEDAVAAAGAAAQAGDPAEAARLMRLGLAQWRGPALYGIDGKAVRTEAERLDNRRLTVLEDCLACELELGRHTQVLDELTRLVTENPFRERLVLHLMSALYQSGRRADALTVYRQTDTMFRDELGVDPGVELGLLHEAILRDELAPTPRPEQVTVPVVEPPVVRPAELPADLVDFTGRDAELERLDQALPGNSAAAQPTAVPILAITGAAGVGKTALAVHWAHLAAPHFPDGQLFLDLRGHTTTPVDALASLVRSLGVPAEEVPTDVDDAGRMFRSLVSGRRMLMLVDNVAAADQVPPLLPGSAGCLVVLTSRDNLAGLTASNGAQLLPLDVLDGADAVDLLAKVVGEDGVTTEPHATAELARSCAYLPRELRIAAAQVSTEDECTIGDYVSRPAVPPVTTNAPATRTAFDVPYPASSPATLTD